MLYTRRGDDGSTKMFGCDQRISKSATIAEALGSLDELNSFLGLCKIKAELKNISIFLDSETESLSLDKLTTELQQDLFIIQAELAGADKKIEPARIKYLESIVDTIEKQLPPIKSFILVGGEELSALYDVARTIARRAERFVVRAKEEKANITENTLAYLNRLSSVLYALARLVNAKNSVTEENPHY